MRMEWTLRWSTLCGEGGGVLVIFSAGSTTLSEVLAYHTDALNNAAVEVSTFNNSTERQFLHIAPIQTVIW